MELTLRQVKQSLNNPITSKPFPIRQETQAQAMAHSLTTEGRYENGWVVVMPVTGPSLYVVPKVAADVLTASRDYIVLRDLNS